MKKLIVLTVAIGLCAVSTYAQGLIVFQNGGTTLVTTNVGGVTGAPTASSSGGVKVQLYYQSGNLPTPGAILSASGTATIGSWETLGATAGILPGPASNQGKFSGGTETTGTDVAPGGNVWLTVVGWSGGFASLQAAITGGAQLFGESAVFEMASGGGGSPPGPANAMVLGAGGFNGLVLTPVPEPSVMILSGLGAAAMLLYRRKK